MAHVAGVAACAIGTRASHPIAAARFWCSVWPAELVASGLKKKQQKKKRRRSRIRKRERIRNENEKRTS